MKAFAKILVSSVSILFVGLCFVSNILAAKPQQPITEGGYAILNDSYGIRSDSGGQYTDCSEGGEDFVQVTYNPSDGNYLKIRAVLGKMAYFDDTSVISKRNINLCFNVLGTPLIDFENDNSNKAVYYILEKYWDTEIDPDNPIPRSSNVGWIDDNSVRAEIFASVASGGVINFLVDPSDLADCSDPRAINDESVNAFYDDDPPNLNYTDTEAYGEGGQVFYRLNFANGFNVDRVEDRKWIITPNSGEVKLSVKKYRRSKSKGVADTIYLATYPSSDGLPIKFELTVWLDPKNTAPRKQETISTVWGSIKQ